MSNDLIAFDTSAGPDAAFRGEQVESLGEGIGQSYPVIHYKGKVWSLTFKGDTHRFTRADDGEPLPYIDVIFLKSAGWKSKSYFPKFVEGMAGGPPLCASVDGVRPDPGVQMQQSEACAICPRNVLKINAEGRKSRECTDYKRTAVLIMPNLTQKLLGQPLNEPAFLRIPPDSLVPLVSFGDMMEAKGFPMHSYVTRIGFDPDKATPKFTFRAIAKVDGASAPVIKSLRDETQSGRIIGEGVVNPVRHVQLAPPTNVVQLQAPEQKTKFDTVNAPISEMAQRAAGIIQPTQAQVLAAPVIELKAEHVDEGLGLGLSMLTAPQLIQEGAKAAVAGAAVGQTQEDTGIAPADANLDALVDSLLPMK